MRRFFKHGMPWTAAVLCLLSALYVGTHQPAMPPAPASQNATALPTSGTYSGLQAAIILNGAFDTLLSQSSGASAPPNPTTWQQWADTTNNQLKLWNGSQWLILGSFASNQWVGFTGGVKDSAPATTGSANAYILTYSPATTAYVTGIPYTWIANFANTGASTINVDGHGVLNITKRGTSALANGDIQNGQIVSCVSDGTQCQMTSPTAAAGFTGPGSSTDNSVVLWNGTGGATVKDGPALGSAAQVLTSNGAGVAPSFQNLPAGVVAATQAQQEAASVTTVYNSPGRQQFHPSATKAWVYSSSTGTVLAGYNVASITHGGTGDFTVNFTTSFSSTNMACATSMDNAIIAHNATISIRSRAAGSVRVYMESGNSPSAIDQSFSVACFGDQ